MVVEIKKQGCWDQKSLSACYTFNMLTSATTYAHSSDPLIFQCLRTHYLAIYPPLVNAHARCCCKVVVGEAHKERSATERLTSNVPPLVLPSLQNLGNHWRPHCNVGGHCRAGSGLPVLGGQAVHEIHQDRGAYWLVCAFALLMIDWLTHYNAPLVVWEWLAESGFFLVACDSAE